MWKIDEEGNAYTERGEKIWLTKEHGHFFIRKKVWLDTKKFHGFTESWVATFPKNYSEDDARESLFGHVDYLNLTAELPHIAIRELYRELRARAAARKKSKMFSLWAQ